MEDQPAILEDIIIHLVGNKNNGDRMLLSDAVIEADDDMATLLKNSFLNRFQQFSESFSFQHPESLQFNEVYQYCRNIFDDSTNFVKASQSIAQHLYNQSIHPRVKGGELYVCRFKSVPVQGRNYEAVGIFKTEHKSVFMEVKEAKKNLSLSMKEGVEINRVDKGCLVINRQEEAGYDVFIFDNQNRGEEAQYWREKFLNVEPQQNEFHHTSHVMALTRQFITGPLEAEGQVSRTEQVELLRKSLDYFKGNDSFDIENFQKEVFETDDRIEAFRNFGSQYVEQHDYDIASSFDISNAAVKKQSRIFKSVLKLDKNFHIYIHGRTDLIERGVDDNGRKYYKIYYQEEA